MKIILKIFPQKFLLGANGPFWAQKRRILITLDLLQEFFLKFCTMKRVNSYVKVILMAFTKKILFKEMDHFGSENDTSS